MACGPNVGLEVITVTNEEVLAEAVRGLGEPGAPWRSRRGGPSHARRVDLLPRGEHGKRGVPSGEWLRPKLEQPSRTHEPRSQLGSTACFVISSAQLKSNIFGYRLSQPERVAKGAYEQVGVLEDPEVELPGAGASQWNHLTVHGGTFGPNNTESLDA